MLALNILLVNDDGFSSPWIELVCRVYAAEGHHVYVCAPMEQQSAKSQSLTMFNPIMLEKSSMDGADEAWKIGGTPADCSKIGLLNLFRGKIDMVVSGINRGYNAGLDTFPSGTISAAREATFHGVPAMALSADPRTCDETLEHFVKYSIGVAEKYIEVCRKDAEEQKDSLQESTAPVCSLNVPAVPLCSLKSPCFAPLAGRESYVENGYDIRTSPMGQMYAWQVQFNPMTVVRPDCDFDLLSKGHITCTMMSIPMVTIPSEKFSGILG